MKSHEEIRSASQLLRAARRDLPQGRSVHAPRGYNRISRTFTANLYTATASKVQTKPVYPICVGNGSILWIFTGCGAPS